MMLSKLYKFLTPSVIFVLQGIGDIWKLTVQLTNLKRAVVLLISYLYILLINNLGLYCLLLSKQLLCSVIVVPITQGSLIGFSL